MFDSLPTVLMIVFEVFCCKIFFEIFGKVRYKGWINAVQLILLVSGVFGAVKGLKNIFVLKQIAIIILFASWVGKNEADGSYKEIIDIDYFIPRAIVDS